MTNAAKALPYDSILEDRIKARNSKRLGGFLFLTAAFCSFIGSIGAFLNHEKPVGYCSALGALVFLVFGVVCLAAPAASKRRLELTPPKGIVTNVAAPTVDMLYRVTLDDVNYGKRVVGVDEVLIDDIWLNQPFPQG